MTALAAVVVIAPAAPSSATGTCTAVGLVEENAGTAGDLTCVFDQGAEVFNVMAYGAKGYLDDNATNAIEAANAAATAADGIVFFPPGEYRYTRPLTATASWYGASVGDVVLHAKVTAADPPWPTNSFAITAGNPDRFLTFYNLRITGPVAGVKGQRSPKNWHGLAINTPMLLRRVGVDHWDQGITFNTGHVNFEMGQAGENYAGLYINTNEPGIFVTGTVLTGNTTASIVSPASVTITGLRTDRVHLGNSPWAIYQEAGTGPGWMDGVSLERTAFEAIGNSAVLTENVADPVTSLVKNLYVASGGGSFKGKASSYGLPTRSDDYCWVLGSTAGSVRVTGALADLPRHAKGVYSIADNQGSIEVFRANMYPRPPYDMTFDVGGRPDLVQFGVHNVRAHRRSATIPAGSSSVVVQTEYLGPVESLYPFVQATGTSASGQQLALVVSGVESAYSYLNAARAVVPGYTRFTVTAVGGVPTTDVAFTWQVGDDLT